MREVSASECTSDSAPRRVNVAEVPEADVVEQFVPAGGAIPGVDGPPRASGVIAISRISRRLVKFPYSFRCSTFASNRR